MKTVVWVTSEFAAFHRWAKAPEHVAFLRDYHRHVFKVRLAVQVSHGDRDVEFFTLKQKLETHLSVAYSGRRFDYSCEMIANALLKEFDADEVIVSEDGENGATVTKDANDSGKIVEATHPVLVKQTKCFIGTEAEGPHRGSKVLFVPGSFSSSLLQELLILHGEDLDRVYLGAKNDRTATKEQFDIVQKLMPNSTIDIEVEFVPKWLKDVKIRHPEITVISYDLGTPDECDYVKLIREGIIIWVGEGKEVRVTSLNDPLFLQDREV